MPLLDFRAYEQERRVLWSEVFEDELIQLHKGGFAHRDLLRPSDIGGQPFDNILLTQKGIRLIDTGISALKEQVGEKLFARFVKQELEEFEKFRGYFLSR
ncbi:MAG: hypothetical protein COZ18_07400 [Flexibacter sp. CG_4_10_14_3_um_filter_32_15]|nr:MAG: hypothetical protein COZ18_07400 [Flexibacter sp. CG_4_10_14_3_um_filter_32_15]